MRATKNIFDVILLSFKTSGVESTLWKGNSSSSLHSYHCSLGTLSLFQNYSHANNEAERSGVRVALARTFRNKVFLFAHRLLKKNLQVGAGGQLRATHAL